MSKYINHILSSFKTHPTIQLTTIIVLTGTYVLISTFFVAKSNIDGVLSSWGEKVRLNIYLTDSATDDDINKIKSKLSKLKKFSPAEYVSKEQAAKNFMASMAQSAPDLLNNSELGNPLPASLELSIKSSTSGAEHLKLLKIAAESIRAFSGVEEVSYGQGWVKNYSDLVSGFKNSSYAFLLLLILGSMLVVSNSIRSSVSQRLEEVEVLELVGATQSMIRTPYIIEGMVLGLITSILAIMGTYLLFLWQQSIIIKEFDLITFGGQFHFLNLMQILGVISLGVSMGAAGSYFSVSKINTGWAAAKRTNGANWQ